MRNQDYLLNSVKNSMRILRLFSLESPELGVTEIALKLGLSKSTAHRLITTLAKEGYLEKTPERNRYRLGLSLLGLSGVITTNMEIHREAVPILESLVEWVGEAAHISILEGRDVVYLHKVDCSHPVRLLSHIGKRNPAYCTSSGKVLLAYQSDEVIHTVLESELYPHAPNTITDKSLLRQNLEKIKRQGYSIAIDELHEGVVSLAVPVRDYTNEVVAAISIVGPKQRMKKDQYPDLIDCLKGSAAKLSEQLGYSLS